MRNGARFYCETPSIGMIVYDNEEKLRLQNTYQAQEETEVESQRLNLERLQNVLLEQESTTALSNNSKVGAHLSHPRFHMPKMSFVWLLVTSVHHCRAP